MKLYNNTSRILIIACITVLFAGPAVFQAGAEDTCIECHKDKQFRTRNPVLFNYYNNWKNSIHELENITCVDCHGGDPDSSEKEAAHGKNFSSLTSIDRDSFKEIPQRCGECHEAILENFTKSKHYKALMEKGTGPHCSTCHGSVNADVYYTSVISRACKDCHNEYTKNRPEIVGEADKILHRINVARAFRRWILINYQEKEPAKVEAILALYTDVAQSWHKFNFKELDQKSQDLLHKMKSLRKRALVEKKKKAGGK